MNGLTGLETNTTVEADTSGKRNRNTTDDHHPLTGRRPSQDVIRSQAVCAQAEAEHAWKTRDATPNALLPTT
jgi:hypothetical protein